MNRSLAIILSYLILIISLFISWRLINGFHGMGNLNYFRKIVLGIILLPTLSFSQSQPNVKKDFRYLWNEDVNGCKGFRSSSLKDDSIQKIVLINEKNIKGYNVSAVLNLLGKTKIEKANWLGPKRSYADYVVWDIMACDFDAKKKESTLRIIFSSDLVTDVQLLVDEPPSPLMEK